MTMQSRSNLDRGGNRWVWSRIRALVMVRDNRRCQLGIPGVCTSVATEVDHIHPRSLGGGDEMDNLRLALPSLPPWARHVGVRAQAVPLLLRFQPRRHPEIAEGGDGEAVTVLRSSIARAVASRASRPRSGRADLADTFKVCAGRHGHRPHAVAGAHRCPLPLRPRPRTAAGSTPRLPSSSPGRTGRRRSLLPHILDRKLRAGRRVLHTAQNREIPRETFELLAGMLDGSPEVEKNGIRWANGQEVIKFVNGGRYTLVAPRHGVRGHHADHVIQDEVREQRDESLRAAMMPTLTASPNGQTIYLSNAGDDESVVLNALRRRKDERGPLAYLEWSASPERGLDDLAGWAEANPALGTTITLETLRNFRTSFTAATFETEHLCRWVATTRERLVDEYAWNAGDSRRARPAPRRPFMAVSMSPDGTRASAAIAWQMDSADMARWSPSASCSTSRARRSTRPDSARISARRRCGWASRRSASIPSPTPSSRSSSSTAEPISGGKYANATANFVNVVTGNRLRWHDVAQVTDDLTWTARKPHDESGSYQAVRANDERPITAALASIEPSGSPPGQSPLLRR